MAVAPGPRCTMSAWPLAISAGGSFTRVSIVEEDDEDEGERDGGALQAVGSLPKILVLTVCSLAAQQLSTSVHFEKNVQVYIQSLSVSPHEALR